MVWTGLKIWLQVLQALHSPYEICCYIYSIWRISGP
jgi:hypothetical protein